LARSSISSICSPLWSPQRYPTNGGTLRHRLRVTH